ncbi:MAG TPA: anthranilate phosphoribosyltransferase, partial [Methanocella sp.]|nr:anthranilate phosphoribosyltransferase [Methanocella sp.]
MQLIARDMGYFIGRLVDGRDLTQEEAVEAMRFIMTGRATQSQIGGFLTA